jgi:hypothetical protein
MSDDDAPDPGLGGRASRAAIEELEFQLREAQERTRRAAEAVRGKHRGGEMERYRTALASQLDAERQVALARGEPAAFSIAWDPPWDVGVPAPHVLSSGHETLLLYRVSESDPTRDGNSARMVDVKSELAEPIALVRFQRCYGHRFGGPNDEVLEGHPLHGRGLDPYRAHRVENSPWIAEERRTNSVHRGFRPETWEGLVHYVLLFHDDMFECIAREHTVERLRCSFQEALEIASAKLFER